MFTDKKLIQKVIMDCRAIAAHKFRTRFVFKHYDVILNKEQLVLSKRKVHLKEKNMKTQQSVLIIGLIHIFITTILQYNLMKMVILREVLTMQ